MAGRTYEQVTLSGTGPSMVGTDLIVWQTLDGTGPGRYGEPWFRCIMCGMSFPKSKVRFFRGKAYGVPCTDSNDIAQLVRKKK